MESIHTFNSFKGEVYENILYELLLDYAKHNDFITKFILKGPHQNKKDKLYKTGLMIDRSLQIVYKSNYKDISEFDALFFTKDSLYFVEMSTSKKSASLNKRLFKKYALLKILFPKLHIRALIILTEGTQGIRNFPNYCTVWITKDLIDNDLLRKLVFTRRKRELIKDYNDSKFVEAFTIKHRSFIYFKTLEWILKACRSNENNAIDIEFFRSKKLSLYFDLYTKLYIGFIQTDKFLQLIPDYDSKIDNVFVTIEKINTKAFGIVYYVKNVNGKLRRVFIDNQTISIKDKELDGFTNVEVRFMSYLIEDKYYLLDEEIEEINKNLNILLK